MASTTPTGRRAAKAEMTPPGARSVVSISCGGSGRTVDSIAPRAYRWKRSTTWVSCRPLATFQVAPGLGLDQGGELVVAGGHGVTQGIEQPGPLGRVGLGPGAEGGSGGVNCRVGVVDRRVGRLAHDRLGGRVVDLVGPPAAGDELTADEELLRSGIDGSTGGGHAAERSPRI